LVRDRPFICGVIDENVWEEMMDRRCQIVAL
jgi:hypothetical protein